MICTSCAARKAIDRLFEHVGDALASTLGTALRFRGELPIIPLGVDVERFRPRNRQEIRTRLTLPSDAFIVLYLGRVSRLDKADLAPLLVVFARLVRANPSADLRLVIAGSTFDGATQDLRGNALALGIAESVHFVDAVDPLDTHLWYSAADVFVSPADCANESFGLTPIEAMACGIPQVVSDWNGYADTVVNGETGFLIPTWWDGGRDDLDFESALSGDGWEVDFERAQSVVVDVPRWQACIQELLDSEALRTRMSENSRQRAMNKYAWSEVVSEHVALWKHLVEVSRSSAQAPNGRHYGYPNHIRCFSHYCSHVICGGTRVAIIADGDDCRRTVASLSADPWLASSITADLVTQLIDILLRYSAIAYIPTLDEMTRQLDPCKNQSQVERHVLWMAKMGLLELMPPR